MDQLQKLSIDVEQLSNKVSRLCEVIYDKGNQTGLLSLSKKLFDNVEMLTLTMDIIQADLKVLLRFQVQQETKEEMEKEHKDQMKYITNLIATVVIAVVGLVVTTIVSIIKG